MRYNVTGESEDGGTKAMRGNGRFAAALPRDMRDALKLFLLALAAAAVVGVPVALAGQPDQPVRANLDGDAEEELAIAQPLGGGADGGARRRIVVVDVCNYRNTVYHVSPVYDKVDLLKALDVDGRRPAKEVLFAMSNGTSGQSGYFKLLRMVLPAARARLRDCGARRQGSLTEVPRQGASPDGGVGPFAHEPVPLALHVLPAAARPLGVRLVRHERHKELAS
jgi:hypothetical protein